MQGVGAAEMSNGDQPVIGISTKYQDPGIYTVEVRPAQLCVSPHFGLSKLCHLQCSASADSSESNTSTVEAFGKGSILEA